MRRDRPTRDPSTMRPDIVADPLAQSRSISRTLPDLIEQAEAAGLSIIAQHLGRALALAQRVAASGEGRAVLGDKDNH